MQNNLSQQSVTRRGFVAAAGAVAATGAVAHATRALAAAPTPVSSVEAWVMEADVVICGCGTGGVAAAVAAADEGAEVVIIEKRDWVGGQLRRSGGAIAAAETQVQKALGIEDSAEDFADYWIATTDGCCDEELVRNYALNSASLIDWVIDDLGGQPADEWEMCGADNGLEYDEGPGLNVGTMAYESYGFEPKQRCHWFNKYDGDPFLEDDSKYLWPSPGGTGLWKVFSDAMAERGVEPLTETALVGLVTVDGTNEVAGVVAEQGGEQIRIKARKGVVIATGNFAGDQEMFHNYVRQEWSAGSGGGFGFVDLPDENDGSGIRAAMAAGGVLAYPGSCGLIDGFDVAASFAMNGLKVNTDAQVLDAYGDPVPRLFAAGLAGGGMINDVYPTCGASVGRSLFYGRVAGQVAAGLEPLA